MRPKTADYLAIRRGVACPQPDGSWRATQYTPGLPPQVYTVPVPDETTVCRFHHLLEAHDLGRRLFDEVQRHLAEKGLKIATGMIVDATISSAPSSTKNADKARDSEMHQTKKGNQWYSLRTVIDFPITHQGFWEVC